MSKKTTKGTGVKGRVLGTKIVVNLNAKKGYRVSPGVNARAKAIQQCAKKQSLATRKNCFKAGAHAAKK